VFFFTTTDKYHEQLRATHIVFKSDAKTRCARQELLLQYLVSFDRIRKTSTR